MPCASAPNAPCVQVCESPQTTVMPGSVAPCSGPITCTMPWRLSQEREVRLRAELARCSRPASRPAAREIGSRMPCVPVASSACCGRRSRRSSSTRHGLRPGQLAGLRTPAGWSLRAPGGGRCRGARCRLSCCGRRARPRSCRRACGCHDDCRKCCASVETLNYPITGTPAQSGLYACRACKPRQDRHAGERAHRGAGESDWRRMLPSVARIQAAEVPPRPNVRLV